MACCVIYSKSAVLTRTATLTFVPVGAAPQRVVALSRGLIDASSFIAPQDIQAQKLGMHELTRYVQAWALQSGELLRHD